MIFWIVSIALTAAVILAVMLPFVRTGGSTPADRDHDVEVYRDQLDELDRDLARGAIEADQAELARAEIARRLIKADAGQDPSDTALASGAANAGRVTLFAAVLAVPVLGWGMYAMLGSPDEPDQPLQARLSREPAQSSVAELVARAEQRLKTNPDDLRGWDVLAPIYIATGRFDDSVAAFRNAIRLGGPTARREAGLGEALVGKAEGRVGLDAVQAFERALALDPHEPRARFYIATAKAQQGNLAEAARMWEALAGELPGDSPLRRAVLQAAADSRARLGQPPVADGQPGPTRDDVAAASEMSSADRQAMIETMVANLDQKLRDDHDDIDGWKRLLRSFVVLGKGDEARDALNRAVAAYGEGSQGAIEIAQFARSVGIEETTE